MTQTKKATSIPIVTTAATGDHILMTNQDKYERIAVNDFRTSLVGDISMNTICSNIYVVWFREDSWINYRLPMYCPLSEWPALQASGKVGQGILVNDGDKSMIVALTESANTLLWGSNETNLGGGFVTGSREAARYDYAGKANTAAIIKSDGYKNDGDGYAPGFCAKYKAPQLNSMGKGLDAGDWWLPSIGELWLMAANFEKINYALGLVNGAQKLVRSPYWSSTEYSTATAWHLGLSDGVQGGRYKSQLRHRVRAVAAFV